MKKFAILMPLIFVALASCKKEAFRGCMQDDKISVTDATVVKSGNLIAALLPKLSGVVKIYLQKNGRYVLGIEQITLSGNSDLSAYFSATPVLSSGAAKLFSFKSIDGQLYYLLPAGIATLSARYLVVQGDISSLPAALAELK